MHLQNPHAARIRFVWTTDDGTPASEILWGDALGDSQYRLGSIPYRAPGISAGDTVLAPELDGQPTFRSVVARGGHSTFRIALERGVAEEKFLGFWPVLETLGCRYEQSRLRWYALDVPEDADIEMVVEILHEGEDEGVWRVEEAHAGHNRQER